MTTGQNGAFPSWLSSASYKRCSMPANSRQLRLSPKPRPSPKNSPTSGRALQDAGYATFGARSSKHDDLVLALAIATWWLARQEKDRVRIDQFLV